MDNLVQEINGIEKQADQLIEDARMKARRVEEDTTGRIRSLEEELAQSVKKAIEAHRAARVSEKEAEEARLRQAFDKGRAAIASVSADTIQRLAGKIVERVKSA
ncbi:MAG TPA: hypothetical protein PL033_13750 [Candidatus Brocadiia bacterium]|nr:hypothetical protein [Candidatus Brocadiia bacterium]